MNIDRALIVGILYSPDFDLKEKVKKAQAVNHKFTANNRVVFDYIIRHIERFEAAPSDELLTEEFPNFDWSPPKDPFKAILYKAEETHKFNQVREALNAAEESLMSGSADDAMNALILMTRDFERKDSSSNDIHVVQDYDNWLEEYKRIRDTGEVMGLSTGFKELDELTNGIQDGDFWLFAARPGGFKCVWDQTMVRTITGDRITLREFQKRGEQYISSLDESSGKIVNSKVNAIVDTGEKEGYRVRTRTGKEVVVSEDHPFLTDSGWRSLNAGLSVGDRVAIPTKLPIECGATVELDDAYLLGLLISEGGTTKGEAIITNADTEIVDWLRNYCRKYDLKLVKSGKFTYRLTNAILRGGHRRNRARNLVADYGLKGKKAEQKVIPDAVFTWTREAKAFFLKGLLDGDGTVTVKGNISYCSSSLELVRGITSLLLEFSAVSALGVHGPKHFTVTLTNHYTSILMSQLPALIHRKQARLRLPKKRTKNGLVIPSEIKQQLYEVIVAYGKSKLADDLGLAKGSEKFNRLIYDSRKVGREYLTRIMTALGDHLPAALRAGLKSLRDREVYMDDIIAIDPIGKVVMVDLEIEGTHNFVANDILLHNSWLLTYMFSVASNECVDCNVLFFSKEMTRQQIYQRFLAILGSLNYNELRKYELDDDRLEQIRHRLYEHVKGSPLIIGKGEYAKFDASYVKAKIVEYEPRVTFIDGLYLFEESAEWKDQTGMTRTMRQVSLDTSVPIVGTVQLNKKGEMAYSDSYMQDATVVVYMERQRDEVQERAKNTVRLKVKKYREGESDIETYMSIGFRNTKFVEGRVDPDGNEFIEQVTSGTKLV